MPRHNTMITPAKASKRGRRDRVQRIKRALEGGRRALVDFQVTPPLGKSISSPRMCRRQSQKVC